jgi:hypothetical protein
MISFFLVEKTKTSRFVTLNVNLSATRRYFGVTAAMGFFRVLPRLKYRFSCDVIFRCIAASKIRWIGGIAVRIFRVARAGKERSGVISVLLIASSVPHS